MDKPELLAPAGDLEKLKMAVACGADAIYIGGRDFGLRAQAKNFDTEELAEGIRYAHERRRRVYVTANIFAHNADIDRMGAYLRGLEAAGADAVIVSDPGVFELVREVVPGMCVHISTQANNTNYRSARFWHRHGAGRVVLARELTFEEISRINAEVPGLELEAFVHGAMCISYSGRCLLSGYMTGRDANSGECAQPCRWEYYLSERNRRDEYMPVYEDERGTYIFNSKDLCVIEHIPRLLAAGVSSFKIEGRMKSVYYVGCVVKAWREAIDDYFAGPEVYRERLDGYKAELEKVSHRPYTTGLYLQRTGAEYYADSAYTRTHDFIAVVLDYEPETGYAVIEQRNRFVTGDTVEVFRTAGRNYDCVITELTDADGRPVGEAPHARQRLRVRLDGPVQKFDMLRRKRV